MNFTGFAKGIGEGNDGFVFIGFSSWVVGSRKREPRGCIHLRIGFCLCVRSENSGLEKCVKTFENFFETKSLTDEKLYRELYASYESLGRMIYRFRETVIASDKDD